MRTPPFPRLAAVALLVGSAVGCPTGPSAGSLRVAHSPRGVGTELHVGRAQISGELLEVRDTAFVILAPTREVVLVPFRAVRRASFDQLKFWYSGGTPQSETLRDLRRVSRFPQGMSAEALSRVLASTGQTAPRVATP